jgi:hypothetical protein
MTLREAFHSISLFLHLQNEEVNSETSHRTSSNDTPESLRRCCYFAANQRWNLFSFLWTCCLPQEGGVPSQDDNWPPFYILNYANNVCKFPFTLFVVVFLLEQSYRREETCNKVRIQQYFQCIKVIRSSKITAGHWWLTPVILATQETEIRRIMIWSQLWQIVHKTLSWKYPLQKRVGGEGEK